MSTHEVKVFNLKNCNIIKHPNADTLSLVEVNGYTALLKTDDIDLESLYAFIEPDYVVPDTEQFAFLQGKRRIKCKRLRGVMSHGLLIKAPPGAQEGDNVMELLGVVKYEPPERGFRGGHGGGSYSGSAYMAAPPEGIDFPKYGLEHYRKNKRALQDGDLVYITEKIHGSSAAYVFDGEVMHVKSHSIWRKESETDAFWVALRQNPWVEEWCRAHPHCVLLGEVYGSVQDLEYGMPKDKLGFAAFDIIYDGKFWTQEAFHEEPLEVKCPLLYCGPFSKEELEKHVDGNTTMPGANHIREGVVIKKAGLTRCALKFVSDEYLCRAK